MVGAKWSAVMEKRIKRKEGDIKSNFEIIYTFLILMWKIDLNHPADNHVAQETKERERTIVRRDARGGRANHGAQNDYASRWICIIVRHKLHFVETFFFRLKVLL